MLQALHPYSGKSRGKTTPSNVTGLAVNLPASR